MNVARMARWALPLVVLVCLAFVVSGCSPSTEESTTAGADSDTTNDTSNSTDSGNDNDSGSNSDAEADSDAAEEEPENADAGANAPNTLTIATGFGIADIVPLTNSFWGPEFGYIELLMRPERNGTPSPWILSSLEATSDLTWELGIRDNVEFVNGNKLTAEGVVALLNYVNENNESFAASASIDSVEVTDDATVTLTTTKPVPSLANVFADESMVPVFDVEAFTAAGGAEAPDAVLDAGIYTGPYYITSLTEQAAELSPVDNYWDGTPALSAVTIKFVPETTSRVQAVQAGEVDIALYMPTSVALTLDGRDDAFYVTGQPTGTTFAMQLRSAGAFEDTAVRRAVFAAVDYRELAEDVMDGQAEIATSVFAPSFPYAVDTQATDLDLANKLLDDAGWAMDGDTRKKDGETLTMRIISYPQQPDSNTLAVALQNQFKAVGIDVAVTEVPDIREARKGDDWDLALSGASLLSFSLSPEDGLRDALVTDGRQNWMGVSNAELDAAVTKLGETFDAEERNAILGDIQQIIHDNGLWGATIWRQPAVVTSAEWNGYETPLANLWIDAKTAPSQQ